MNSALKPDSGVEARQLLDMWGNLSQRHVSLAGSCACGIGGVTLQLQDFEQDIIDFLQGQAERAKRTDVSDFLKAHAREPESGRWDVALLLKTLGSEDHATEIPSDITSFLLGRLGKTLRSFARLHG